jgi:sugar transferase EpsL
MSLVGPRPLLAEYLPLYSTQQLRRHDVLPGITGWAQVNGRNAIEWDDRLRNDIWYVDNQSFWLDVRILRLTFLKVLNREGINKKGQVSIEKFEGSKYD